MSQNQSVLKRGGPIISGVSPCFIPLLLAGQLTWKAYGAITKKNANLTGDLSHALKKRGSGFSDLFLKYQWIHLHEVPGSPIPKDRK